MDKQKLTQPVKGVAYGILFWVWYQVLVAIGASIHPSAVRYVQEILNR